MSPTRLGGGSPGLFVSFYLLAAATSALAHVDDAERSNGQNGTIGEALVGNSTDTPSTYFTYIDHASIIYAHIVLMILAWVILLPIAVMLSIAKSRHTLATQFVFIIANTVGIVLSTVYNASTPDLYPNNAHHKIGWIITWVVSAHFLVNLARRFIRTQSNTSLSANYQMLHQLLPTSGQDSGSYLQDSYHDHESRASDDSGLGTASDLSPAHNCFTSTVCAEDRETRAEPSKEYSGSHGECGNLPPSSADFPGHTLRAEIGHIVSHKLLKVLELGYKVVDRVILPFGFIALTTGIITFARFFEGHAIFGGLAHWIKGGVFFWLGLFNLGRWSGSFAELGWAWNLRPRRQSRQKGNFNLSAEFMESSLILVYGSTNIFLEHLGGWGGAWTAQDLEHMAITVLFIGGGLFGMLIESIHIRDLLNTTTSVSARSYSTEERGESNAPDTYQFSLNPIPALVILLLGIMMSSHHQATMTASMVHEQWGTLLLWASVARGLTYVLLYLRPPKSIFPSRPPTELLTSFGLIAGGIIFMASSSDTVNGMIHYSLDAMLLYTVTTGLVGILMAWEIAVLAIKGWAVRKELVLHG